MKRLANLIVVLLVLHLRTFCQAPDSLSVDSTANRGFGFLKVLTNVDSLFLIPDGKYREAKLVTRSEAIRLTAGEHVITLAHYKFADHRFAVTIVKDQIVEYKTQFQVTISPKFLLAHSSYPLLRWGANVVVLTDQDSDVYLDTTHIGGGFAKVFLGDGMFSLRTTHAYAGSSQKTIRPQAHRMTVLELYNKPDPVIQRVLSPFPGFAQFHKNEPYKGALFLAGTSVSIASAFLFHVKFIRDDRDYEHLAALYKQASTETAALTLGDEAESKFNSARLAARIRDVSLGTALIIWALNIVDALTDPDDGYREKKSFDPMAPWSATDISLSLRINLPAIN